MPKGQVWGNRDARKAGTCGQGQVWSVWSTAVCCVRQTERSRDRDSEERQVAFRGKGLGGPSWQGGTWEEEEETHDAQGPLHVWAIKPCWGQETGAVGACVIWQVGDYWYHGWEKLRCLSFALLFLQLQQKSFTAITWNTQNQKEGKNESIGFKFQVCSSSEHLVKQLWAVRHRSPWKRDRCRKRERERERISGYKNLWS